MAGWVAGNQAGNLVSCARFAQGTQQPGDDTWVVEGDRRGGAGGEDFGLVGCACFAQRVQ